ncbi:hypothetical protein FXO37_17215 [Capsicum annuum]|nr:hypothetical protein FXO37_17215 [Capsicum annuum]
MERPTVSGKDTDSPDQTVAGKDSSNPLMGVHSTMNIERPTVLDNDTSSPAQMVAGKDSSNLLTADTLPKSVRRILPASFTTTGTQTTDEECSSKTKKGFPLRKKKNEKINIEKIVVDSIKELLVEQLSKGKAMNPEPPEPRPRISFTLREETRPPRIGTKLGLSDGDSDEYDRDYNSSMDQFAQDPNVDDDSGMNFDSEALHNLDMFDGRPGGPLGPWWTVKCPVKPRKIDVDSCGSKAKYEIVMMRLRFKCSVSAAIMIFEYLPLHFCSWFLGRYKLGIRAYGSRSPRESDELRYVES